MVAVVIMSAVLGMGVLVVVVVVVVVLVVVSEVLW